VFLGFHVIFASDQPKTGCCFMSSKERIIEESTNLFVRYGVKSVRMDDIASRLGISKRTVYELFGDRESLIIACVRHFYARQAAIHEDRIAQARNVIEEFVMLLDDWEAMVTTNLNFMNDLERFYPAIYGKIKDERHREGRDRLKMKLEQGIEEGLFFRNINLDFAAAALIASVSTVFTTPSAYESVNVPMSEAFKYITMCFFRGIATEKGIRLIDRVFRERFAMSMTLSSDAAGGGASGTAGSGR